jgi:hypothetical protein
MKIDECHSRYVNVGLYYLRQVFFAKFDLKVHVDKGLNACVITILACRAYGIYCRSGRLYQTLE